MSYQNLMYLGLALAFFMLVVSIMLFIRLEIPRVIGSLTGYTARKAIREMRENNDKTGKKGYRVSPVNRERSKLTSQLGGTGAGGLQTTPPDQPLGRELNRTEVLPGQGSATTVLTENQSTFGETMPLAGNATEVFFQPSGTATTVLAQPGQTAALEEYQAAAPFPAEEFSFQLEQDETVIHTEESLEEE